MDHLGFVPLVGGVPFVDGTFDCDKMLTAVAVKRAHVVAAVEWQQLPDLLKPARAYELAREHYGDHPPIDASVLTHNELEKVAAAKASIRKLRPEWTALVGAPVLYMKVSTPGLFSMTNPVIPQIVFLGEEALGSTEDLVETLVHELAHMWLGLLNEVWPLAVPGDSDRYTLPSGTANKSTLSLILATHFAASAVRLHQAATVVYQPRLTFLRTYLSGCIQLLRGATALTRDGRTVARQLEAFMDEQEPPNATDPERR